MTDCVASLGGGGDGGGAIASVGLNVVVKRGGGVSDEYRDGWRSLLPVKLLTVSTLPFCS